jgi:arylsulfatase A-like enzyme
MPNPLTRRDFLKISATLSLSPLIRFFPAPLPAAAQAGTPPNVIMVFFDALSAGHLSLYGYPRKTSPNLERLAARSTVYHNHHSAGNFTTPSTASLFTSTYPWTHRAYNLGSLISPQALPNNLFRLLKPLYYQSAFAENTFADMLLFQFQKLLDQHEPVDRFSLVGHTLYDKLTRRDAISGLESLDQFLFKREEAHGSLVLSILNDLATQLDFQLTSARLKGVYPEGLPRLANTDVYFALAQVMDGVMGLLDSQPAPSFTYLHFMPPHAPYMPARPYFGMFADGWAPPVKKKHRLSPGVSEERLTELRDSYDAYVANLDAEFGRLLDHLEASGLLDTSYLIFSSDHGELFERGASGHSTPLVFEPVIHVPLLISAPGQRQRQDVHDLTSNVDLLPSLLKLNNLAQPDWIEGQPLPGFGGEAPGNGVAATRDIYVVEAKANPAYQPLHKATVVLIRDRYKLVHYLGYKSYNDVYEFYDLGNDPEELQNLYPDHPAARELQAELDRQLARVNQRFQK